MSKKKTKKTKPAIHTVRKPKKTAAKAGQTPADDWIAHPAETGRRIAQVLADAARLEDVVLVPPSNADGLMLSLCKSEWQQLPKKQRSTFAVAFARMSEADKSAFWQWVADDHG